MTILPSPVRAAFLKFWRRLSIGVASWAGLTYGPLIMSALLSVAVLGVSWVHLAREHRQAVRIALVDGANITGVVADSVRQALERAELYARLAANGLLRPDSGFPLLDPSLLGDQVFDRIAVFDSGGETVFASSPDLPLRLREHASDMLRHGQRWDSRVLIEDGLGSEQRSLPVLLPVVVPGSSEIVGVMAAMLDLRDFLERYREVELGSGGALMISSGEGRPISRLNGEAGLPSSVTSGALLGELLRDSLPRREELVRDPTGESILVAYQRLEGFPLVVSVVRDFRAVERELAPRRAQVWSLAVLLSLLFLLSGFALSRLAQRQQRLYNKAAATELENRDLIALLREEKSRAYMLASHDHLTGLPNRRLFSEMATSQLLQLKRGRKRCGILFIDLDRFKNVNDTLGHHVGDLLLRQVADRLKGCVREADIVARLGGDEFLILANEITQIDDARQVATRVLESVSRPMNDVGGHVLEVQPSIGIALYPQDGQELEVLMKHADLAMYEAKRSGRGCFRFYDDSLNQRMRQSLALESRLREAISMGHFLAHYQPRVATSDFRICGLEALVRWDDPQAGRVYPSDFIPVAEESGLIVPLGRWMLDAVCRQQRAWLDAGVAVVPVAINVSLRQLRDPNFVADWHAAIDAYQLPPHLLEMEVTESCVAEHIDTACAILEDIVALGCAIAIDDYGTGYSSLSYLKRLPISAIKIDRSFIQDLHSDFNDKVIVDSTVALGHKLGLKVVAEGVETREQLIYLKNVACDEVQGYFFMRPVGAAEIEAALMRGGFVHLVQAAAVEA